MNKEINGLALEIGTRLCQRLEYCKLRPDVVLDLSFNNSKVESALKTYYSNSEIYTIDSIQTNLFNQNNYFATQKLPFEDNSIDLIVSNLFLYHFDSFDDLFLECQRVLTHEGLLLFSTFGNQSFYDEGEAELNSILTRKSQEMQGVGNHLLKALWQDPVIDSEMLSVDYSSLKTLSNDLFELGFINNNSNNENIAIEDVMNLSHKEDEELKNRELFVNFEIIYGHALKNSKKMFKNDLEIKVPISSIKQL